MNYKINPALIKKTQEKISEIDQTQKKTLDVDDILLLSFAYTTKNVYNGSKEEIHKLFNEIKSDYSDEFKEFTFMECEEYPFSKQLERSLFRLQQSQGISIKNPLYKKFEMNNETKQKIIEFFEKDKNEYNKEMIKKIAEKIDLVLNIGN